jgi:hypothetical protein
LRARGISPGVIADPPPRPRNWFALAALWVLGCTWLGLIAVFVFAEGFDRDPARWVLWTLLGVGTTGFVLSLGGFTAMRDRGEAALAFAALALALAFMTFASPFFFYGLGGVGGA